MNGTATVQATTRAGAGMERTATETGRRPFAATPIPVGKTVNVSGDPSPPCVLRRAATGHLDVILPGTTSYLAATRQARIRQQRADAGSGLNSSRATVLAATSGEGVFEPAAGTAIHTDTASDSTGERASSSPVPTGKTRRRSKVTTWVRRKLHIRDAPGGTASSRAAIPAVAAADPDTPSVHCRCCTGSDATSGGTGTLGRSVLAAEGVRNQGAAAESWPFVPATSGWRSPASSRTEQSRAAQYDRRVVRADVAEARFPAQASAGEVGTRPHPSLED